MYDIMVLIFVICVILVNVIRIVIIYRVGQKISHGSSVPLQLYMHLILNTAIDISQPLSHIT